MTNAHDIRRRLAALERTAGSSTDPHLVLLFGPDGLTPAQKEQEQRARDAGLPVSYVELVPGAPLLASGQP
jgi:hypothetical protein